MKAVVAAFNQEKALVGAFSVLMNFRMELFQALPTRDRATIVAFIGMETQMFPLDSLFSFLLLQVATIIFVSNAQ